MLTHTPGVTGNVHDGEEEVLAHIRTPDHRVRVFISSTMGELAPERAAVSEVIRRLRLSPVLFELGARPHPPRALYRAYLDQSHIFVGIYWERYGWVAPDMGISGLEDEFRLCGDQPMLLYVKEPAPAREARLSALISEMHDRPNGPRSFSTPEELADLVGNDLALLLSARFGGAGERPEPTPAIVAPAAVRLPPPLPPTALVGREIEVAETLDLLMRDDVRLVTLSGPGGIGKSRLAVEIATRMAPEFPGGVVFGRLASVTDPELVLPTVVQAAGLHSEGTRSAFDTLVEELSVKPTLVVLDNFEHLLPQAPLLSQLLEACPPLKILVTSRAVLRLHGEWEHPVPPLTQQDAVALFAERAEDARAGTPLAPDDLTAIEEICRRLDGLPLAIELAAARSRLLPPAALLRRLGNRLDLLIGGPADLPARQQTLRNTIDWSYDLLEPQEQLLFARLSIFRGGWTLETAEDVCAGGGVDDVLGVMSILLERSLITISDGSDDGPRFKMLQTIAEYARERLAEVGSTAELEQRLATYLCSLADEIEPHLRNHQARRWGARLDEELDNFRAVVTWLLDRDDTATAVNLIWSLSIHLWTADHLVESRRWIRRAAENTGDLDARTAARLQFLGGATAYEQGDYEEARTCLTEALAGFRAVGDVREQGSALTMLGATYPYFRDNSAAERCLREAVDLLRDVDEPWSLAYALNMLTALVAHGDRDAAAAIATEALGIAERIVSHPLQTQALMQLGYISLLRNNIPEARRLLSNSVRVSKELGFREAMAFSIDALAGVALREGDLKRAATLLGGSAAMLESIGAHVWPLLADEREAIAAGVRRRLGDTDFATARDAGRVLSHTQLVSLAIEAPATSSAAR